MGWRSGRGVSSRQPPPPPALAPARHGRASVPAIQVADSKDYPFSAGRELSPGRAPAHARSHSRSGSVRWQEAHSGPVFSIMAATDQGDSSYSRLQARTTHRAPQLGGVMVISLACWGLLGTPPPWNTSVFEMEGNDSWAQESAGPWQDFPWPRRTSSCLLTAHDWKTAPTSCSQSQACLGTAEVSRMAIKGTLRSVNNGEVCNEHLSSHDNIASHLSPSLSRFVHSLGCSAAVPRVTP